MKKIYTGILVSFILLLSLNSNANSYFGKKNIFRYEIGIWHPAFFGIKGVAMPTIKNGISYERIVSNTISFNIGYNRLDMVDNTFSKLHTIEEIATVLPKNATPIINAKYSSNNFEIGIKKYMVRRNLLVPFGAYIYLGLIYKFEQCKANALTFNSRSSSNYNTFLDTYKANMHDVALSFAVGTNSIYRKRLVVGYEFKFSIPFAAGAQRDLTSAYSQKDFYRMNDLDLKILTKRRFVYSVFTFKFTFGIIT